MLKVYYNSPMVTSYPQGTGSAANYNLREARVKDAKIATLPQLDEILHQPDWLLKLTGIFLEAHLPADQRIPRGSEALALFLPVLAHPHRCEMGVLL